MLHVQAEKRQRQVEAAERAKRAAAEAQRQLDLFRQQNNMGPSTTPEGELNATAGASTAEAQVHCNRYSLSLVHQYTEQSHLLRIYSLSAMDVWCAERPPGGKQCRAGWSQQHHRGRGLGSQRGEAAAAAEGGDHQVP